MDKNARLDQIPDSSFLLLSLRRRRDTGLCFVEDVFRDWQDSALKLLGCILQPLLPHGADVGKEQDEQDFDSFLGHHQNTLHHEALHELRSDALEQGEWAFVFDDVGHNFGEGLKGLAFSGWWRARLQTDFGDDQRLCANRGDGFGDGSKNWTEIVSSFDREMQGTENSRNASKGRSLAFPGNMISFRR